MLHTDNCVCMEGGGGGGGGEAGRVRDDVCVWRGGGGADPLFCYRLDGIVPALKNDFQNATTSYRKPVKNLSSRFLAF